MKICLVTGTRAEYGLLRPVIAALRADPAFEVSLVATAMHLSPEFGTTIREIEQTRLSAPQRVQEEDAAAIAARTPVRKKNPWDEPSPAAPTP